MEEFLLQREKIVLDKGKREDTQLPYTLRIVNIIFGRLDISGLTMSVTSAHIWRVNSIILEYEASDPEYEHSLTFLSHEV